MTRLPIVWTPLTSVQAAFGMQNRLLVSGLLLALASCGGDRTLERAQAALDRGDLDRAEALLDSYGKPGAIPLNDALKRARGKRAGLEADIESAMDRLREGDRGALDDLDALRSKASNRWEKERTGQAVSSAADLAAELRRSKPLPKRTKAAPKLASLPEEPVDGLAESMLEDLRGMIAAREWARSQEALDRLRAEFEEPIPTFEQAAEELTLTIEEDAEAVLDRARREESLRGQAAALEYLSTEYSRFARLGGGLEVHRRFEQLAEKVGPSEEVPAAEPRVAISSAPVGTALTPDREEIPQQSPLDLALKASRIAGDGDLQGASELWSKAALGSVGEEAMRYRVRARDAAARSALRAAILAGGVKVRAAGVDSGDVLGLVLHGERKVWRDLGAQTLLDLADAAGAGTSEGLVGELFALVDGSGTAPASERLHAAWEAGDWTKLERDELLAWHDGAQTGVAYRFVDGRFVPDLEADASELGQTLMDLLRQLEQGDSEGRELAFVELSELAKDHIAAASGMRSSLRKGLFEAGEALLKSAEIERLRRLVDVRAELDRLRADVLARIEDEENYFYPFSVQVVGPERYASYSELQAKILQGTATIEALWNRSEPPISLGEDFRTGLLDLNWCISKLEAMDSVAALPQGVPSWIEGLDPTSTKVSLHNFAWSRPEREEYALWKKIEAHTAKQLEVHGVARNVESRERDMLELTNSYRQMLGRRPLAWNAALQGAAAKHSVYMAETGDLGHIEDSPFPTPGDRMASEGYRSSGGENCYAGRVGPKGAHDSWVRSSAHHRNLIDTGFAEIGVALHGAYWTQVFGRDTRWMAELTR